MKSLKDFNYLLSLDRRYTKTESEIFRMRPDAEAFLEFALSAEGARYLPGGMSLTGSQR